jgi:hypothetical protein
MNADRRNQRGDAKAQRRKEESVNEAEFWGVTFGVLAFLRLGVRYRIRIQRKLQSCQRERSLPGLISVASLLRVLAPPRLGVNFFSY